MVISPLLLLPRLVVAQGTFRHTFTEPLLADAETPGDLALVRFRVCETPLPALFCTCGRYMLFVDDALPDDPPTQETPPCPSGPVE